MINLNLSALCPKANVLDKNFEDLLTMFSELHRLNLHFYAPAARVQILRLGQCISVMAKLNRFPPAAICADHRRYLSPAASAMRGGSSVKAIQRGRGLYMMCGCISDLALGI